MSKHEIKRQLRRHKRTGRAYASFNGKQVTFGAWPDEKGDPTPEARAAF